MHQKCIKISTLTSPLRQNYDVANMQKWHTHVSSQHRKEKFKKKQKKLLQVIGCSITTSLAVRHLVTPVLSMLMVANKLWDKMHYATMHIISWLGTIVWSLPCDTYVIAVCLIL